MENKKLIDTIKYISETATEHVGRETSRSLHITGASCVGNTVVGVGKLVMGILSMSFFTCASAFYTFGMVSAKCFALAGIVKEENSREQYRYYKISGIVLIAASILYIIYSIRLFLNPVINTYPVNIALGIATFTFAELTLNIRGVILERHNRSPLIHAIKMINLASSLICLVLTQTAILSFASEQVDKQPRANGFLGILMGSAATILGMIMIARITQIQNGKNYGSAYRKVKKLMRKVQLPVKMKPVRYTEKEGQPSRLIVRLKEAESRELFYKLSELSEQEVNIILVDNTVIEGVNEP